MENKKLKYIINLQTKKVIAETSKSALYELSADKQIWIPFNSIRTNQLMYWKFTVLAYENDKFTYKLIDTKNKKEHKISLVKLAENILKTPDAYNVEIKEYEKVTDANDASNELIEW